MSEKLMKNEKGSKQIGFYTKLIGEKEACYEGQFKDHIQIYNGKAQIDNKIVRNKLICEIIGDLNQFQQQENIIGESIKNEQYSICMTNNFNTKQYYTVQHLYYRKDDTCSVSVKTCISQDSKKFVVLKILEKTSRQTTEQFENQVQYEIDILKYINKSNTLITLPFIKEEILQEPNQQSKVYILNIDSGIKNLFQVKHFYLANKNYEEYNSLQNSPF
ncbi:hypothetical protein TTHERM_00391260 (macronuclear) [Tetrahymena thermophila SB210]|uniref:Uncharacterized protein n=1 Tax=Tetrahymena thermophila (strain SB210) TaxID=312017 RepID=Q233M4_TETTS|nr:hypothetical protein TTHERM_00391260 [Tetrahymena thermophila SB210]EAR91556.2 hypothetical protein TTHERM_00391260 [Tetrahymena thermophila SB210]|eukprot:XP_001011801.2 hypothetical protein TTHERM_00391260 [Tetrahymena thermophila SB210]